MLGPIYIKGPAGTGRQTLRVLWAAGYPWATSCNRAVASWLLPSSTALLPKVTMLRVLPSHHVMAKHLGCSHISEGTQGSTNPAVPSLM